MKLNIIKHNSWFQLFFFSNRLTLYRLSLYVKKDEKIAHTKFLGPIEIRPDRMCMNYWLVNHFASAEKLLAQYIL